MEITIAERGGSTVVEVAGSVDGMTADELLSTLGEQVKAGRVNLVADLSEVEYTSSAGLRALLATVKAARQHGGDFRIAGVRPDVMRVLEMSGFTSILQVYGGVEEALESFGDA